MTAKDALRSPLFGAALIVSVAVALLLYMQHQPVFAADSVGYINFAPVRTAGYPLFLSAMPIRAVPFAQTIIFGLSALFLSLSFGGVRASGLIALALFANPAANAFHATVLSESLFMSALACFLGAGLRYVRGNQSHWTVALGLAAGLAAAIRPVGLALLVPMILILLSRPKMMFLALGAWCLVVGAERVYSHEIHGDRLLSLAGPHFFAKAGLLDAPATGARGPSAILEGADAPVRDVLKQARRSEVYYPLLAYYEECLQWDCRASLGYPLLPTAALDAAMRHAAFFRIKANPWAYLRLTGDEYRSLWVFGSRTAPANAAAFDRFIRRPMPFAEQMRASFVRVPASRSIVFIRIAFIAIGFVMVLALGTSIVWRRRDLLLASSAVQACSGLTALTAIGYGRYTMVLWPAIVATLWLSATLMLGRAVALHGLRHRFRTSALRLRTRETRGLPQSGSGAGW